MFAPFGTCTFNGQRLFSVEKIQNIACLIKMTLGEIEEAQSKNSKTISVYQAIDLLATPRKNLNRTMF